MRKYSLLLVLFYVCFYNKLSAQEYVPFPTDSSYEWVDYIEAQPCEEGPVHKLYAQFRLNGDTVINLGTDSVANNKTFKKLESKNYSDTGENSWYYYGALREEDKKIYFYPLQIYDTTYLYSNYGYGMLLSGHPQNYLLYDFNKGVGDTVYNVFEGGTQSYLNDSYIINDIDSILIGNEYRKIYYTNNFKIIEGIGDIDNGLLGRLNAIPTCGDFNFTQSCFHNDTSILYLNSGFNTCYSKPTTSVSNIPNNANFSIYPNPVTNGTLNIYNKNQEMYQVKVVDLLGRTILVNNLKQGNNNILLNQNGSTQLLQVLIYDKQNRLVNSNKIIAN